MKAQSTNGPDEPARNGGGNEGESFRLAGKGTRSDGRPRLTRVSEEFVAEIHLPADRPDPQAAGYSVRIAQFHQFPMEAFSQLAYALFQLAQLDDSGQVPEAALARTTLQRLTELTRFHGGLVARYATRDDAASGVGLDIVHREGLHDDPKWSHLRPVVEAVRTFGLTADRSVGSGADRVTIVGAPIEWDFPRSKSGKEWDRRVIGVLCLVGNQPVSTSDIDLTAVTAKVLAHNWHVLVEQRSRRAADEALRKENERLRRENVELRRRQAAPPVLIGSSPAIEACRQKLRQVAANAAPVLLLGESGTGKDIAAQIVHESSGREGPFVAVNCAAFAEQLIGSELFGHVRGAFTGATDNRQGRFAAANGGTLFLDEIGDMPLNIQAKLLRAVEQGLITPVGADHEIEVDVRLIAATNRDLRKMVSEQEFREDLWYRINILQVDMPPLRERKEDIPELVEHFVDRYIPTVVEPKLRFSDDAIARLQDYDWPGNVRELNGVVYRLITLLPPGTSVVDARHVDACGNLARLDGSLPGVDAVVRRHFEWADAETSVEELRESRDRALAMLELEFATQAMRAANQVKTRAARLCGLSSHAAFQRKISGLFTRFPDMRSLFADLSRHYPPK